MVVMAGAPLSADAIIPQCRRAGGGIVAMQERQLGKAGRVTSVEAAKQHKAKTKKEMSGI